MQKVTTVDQEALENIADDMVLAAVDDEDQESEIKRRETLTIIKSALVDSDHEISLQGSSEEEEKTAL